MTAIKIAIIILVLGIVTLTAVSFAEYSLHKPTQPVYSAPTTVQEVKPPTVAELLTLVNAERAKNNVAPLVLDERLNQSAQRKADDEVKYNYSGHISPNDGKHGYEYINDVGIYCKTDGENLYWGNSEQYKNTSDGAVTGWISSKPHHMAMIDPKSTLTGFGINGKEIVEHFCQP